MGEKKKESLYNAINLQKFLKKMISDCQREGQGGILLEELLFELKVTIKKLLGFNILLLLKKENLLGAGYLSEKIDSLFSDKQLGLDQEQYKAFNILMGLINTFEKGCQDGSFKNKQS